MSVNYKIMCEVKLLHEYYLTAKDGSTIFDQPLQADRLNFLRERFSFDYPSVNNHLAYEPAQQETFDNLKLRIIPSYSGFKLFAAVKEQDLPGNIKGYRPALSLADDLPVLIRLRKKDILLDSFSNRAVKRSLPARYYFTNRSLGAPRLLPVLSASLPVRDDTQVHEQGELVFDPGDNRVKAFFFEKNGAKNWIPVKADGYVNTNDLSLLPVNFTYAFTANNAISDASFVLKDPAGTILSTINRTGSPLGKVSLDYSPVVTGMISSATGPVPLPYILEVTATNGYQKTHSLVFCDPSLVQPDTWGLLHLQPRVTDASFQLLDGDGLLITRKNPDGSTAPAPVFEIRIKSRFAFWRYIHNKNKKLQDNAALHPFLAYDAARGYMETITMKNASYTPIEFIHLGIPKYLPNPEMDSPLRMEQQRIYTDIRVPESDLFKSF